MKIIFKTYKSQLWIFIWIVSFFFIFLNLSNYFNHLNAQYFKSIIYEDKEFYISKKTDYNTLLQSLKDSFDIADNVFFKTYAKKKNLSRFIPGVYKLEKGYSLNDIINVIRSRDVADIKITFNASDNFELLSSNFIKNSPNSIDSKQDFIFSIYNYDYSNYIDLSIDSNLVKTLFLPDSYMLRPNCTKEDFIDRMLQEYDRFWSKERLDKANNINLSPIEISILASIVYKETTHEFEYDTIAALYLNRLKNKIPLGSCATANYAFQQIHGFDTTLTRVYQKHTKISSTYNTYIHNGLPPAPICIPSKQTIESVLNAIDHDYMFMCAKAEIDEFNKHILFSGTHIFSSNGYNHEKNAKIYRSALDKIQKDNKRENKGKSRKYKVCYNHYYHTNLDCLNNKEE
tara:strand:- start:539 stop:1741 length:1203 start_codon:yes stop_codon:yes gene_type:complete